MADKDDENLSLLADDYLNNQLSEEDEEDGYFEKKLNEDQNGTSNSSNKKNRNKKNNGTTGIIIFFIVLIIAALFITYTTLNVGDNTLTIDLPEVKTFCVSSTDNSAHDLKAKFTITGDKSTINKIGQKVIYKDVESLLTEIDYASIPLENSNEYVKEYVQTYLSSKYQNINITEIYLTAFSTDNGTKMKSRKDVNEESDDSQSTRNKVLDNVSNWNK